MKFSSTRFGALEVSDTSILTFPSGILGFADWTRYVILDHGTDAPFKWLHCIEKSSLAFVVLDPVLFHANYRVEIPDDVLAEVKGLWPSFLPFHPKIQAVSRPIFAGRSS